MSKRRQFKAEFKARIVLEELTGIKDRAEICREHPLSSQVLARWREEFLERAPEIFATTPSRDEEQVRIGPHLDISLARKREVIEMLAQEYPISVVCQVLGCPRASYYYQPAHKDDETALKAAIKAEAARWPTYGYRRITAQLRRGKWRHRSIARCGGRACHLCRMPGPGCGLLAVAAWCGNGRRACASGCGTSASTCGGPDAA